MRQKMKVGLIGAGLMGHAIAKNILEKGFSLYVMAHKNRQPIARGAMELSSASDMAVQSDLIITCVTGAAQVEAVVYGESGTVMGVYWRIARGPCPQPAGKLQKISENKGVGCRNENMYSKLWIPG